MACEPLDAGVGPWLAGRASKVIIGDTWVGCFGELDPAVVSLYDLRVPINGAEFDVQALMAAVEDPYEAKSCAADLHLRHPFMSWQRT